ARIKSEDEAKPIINQLRHEKAKANHNVYAYVLGDESQIQRASDNGEQSGTAGNPTLEGLLNHDIRDLVAVTTRYCGG
ncbi:YigZ family protein, partial [Lacticaseibacillus casei]|uniref:YigZ family protein n=1 Tax=Lacticaseibacillus casei TaxID=1582 RepID=UPI0030F18080